MILEYNRGLQIKTRVGALNAYTRSNQCKDELQMATSKYTSQSGIYVISNTKNGKIYIGQAQSFKARWQRHKDTLRLNNHRNIHLQRAWNKYGAKAFKFQILEYCPIEQLNEREQHYLDIYIPRGICYNIAIDASSSRGIKRSEETLEKMRRVSTGRKCTERSKAITSAIHKGKVVPDDVRAKISASHMGMKTKPESIAKRIRSLGNHYEVLSPEGQVFEVYNLNQFCKDHKLSQSRMSSVSRGEQDNHRGWKVRRKK